jgi:electron transport complex protein RnfG
MKNNDSKFNNFGKPIIVLVVICLVVTYALAVTYGITKPIIDENNLKASNETKAELLPEAEGDFKNVAQKDLVVLEENKVYVTEASVANNGAGAVITVDSNSYGGILTAMIGIDKDGAITKVKVTSADDTPGVGTKAQASSHLKQYHGLTKLGNIEIKDDPTVQHVTGASISSEAIHKAVYCALKQYHKLGGAN